MTVSLTFSVCVCLLISRGLSVSVSVCVSLSQSLLSLSPSVSLPRFSQASAPPMGQSQLAPHPPPPLPRNLQAGKLPPIRGHSREVGEGGWAWLLRLSLGLCPLHRLPQVLSVSASGGVRAAQRRSADGSDGSEGRPAPGERSLGAPRLGRTLVSPLKDPSASK